MDNKECIKNIKKEYENSGWETSLEGEYDITLKKNGIVFGYVDIFNISEIEKGNIEENFPDFNKLKITRMKKTVEEKKPKIYVIAIYSNFGSKYGVFYETYFNGELFIAKHIFPATYKMCYIATLPSKKESVV